MRSQYFLSFNTWNYQNFYQITKLLISYENYAVCSWKSAGLS